MRIAVCPGSFDPITVGHLDLAERAAAIFDRVILCVVEAAACGGLLADFAREQGACALVKGVRGGTDLDWEMQLAQINRDLFPRLDTVLLPARPEHMHISSTMVREMLRYQQRLEPYIPSGAMRALLRIREGKV